MSTPGAATSLKTASRLEKSGHAPCGERARRRGRAAARPGSSRSAPGDVGAGRSCRPPRPRRRRARPRTRPPHARARSTSRAGSFGSRGPPRLRLTTARPGRPPSGSRSPRPRARSCRRPYTFAITSSTGNAEARDALAVVRARPRSRRRRTSRDRSSPSSAEPPTKLRDATIRPRARDACRRSPSR